MIRELRKSDAPRVLEFLLTQFPEEEALMGTRPEAFVKVIRRVFRWDLQLVIRLARVFGRPIFRFFVIEEAGRIVATTLLTFPERTGYVSTVVVDPAYRRRGFAKALLEQARVTTQKSGRKYIALDVLAHNSSARSLYEAIGYTALRETAFVVREPQPVATGEPSRFLRSFRPADARALVEVARRTRPPEVEAVLPLRVANLRNSGLANRIIPTETAAWVIDRGQGPEAHLSVSSTPTTQSAHISDPVIGENVDARDAAALVRAGIEWCIAHGAQRIIGQVPKANVRGRAALEGGGFHDALALWTLYRPVA